MMRAVLIPPRNIAPAARARRNGILTRDGKETSFLPRELTRWGTAIGTFAVLGLLTTSMAWSQRDPSSPAGIPAEQGEGSNETIFTEAQCLDLVARYHPVALQAQTYVDEAQAVLMRARGGFDPVAGGTVGSKALGGTTYYTAGDASLRAELRGPVGVELGYGAAQGDKMNPERYTPDGGVLRAGVRIDLGQGWAMDIRRAALEQAEGWGQLHAATRLQRVNDLLLEATRAYWNWHRDWHLHAWALEAQRLAEERLQGLQTSVEQGDRPALDLVEAGALLLQRRAQVHAAHAALLSVEATLAAHLWDPQGLPAALPDGARPYPLLLRPETPDNAPDYPTNPPAPDDPEPQWLRTPAALRFDGRHILLETEAALAREQTKPQLSLRAAALIGGQTLTQTDWNPALGPAGNNHQWGVTFAYPLLTRDARARVRLASIQLQRWNWEQQDANRRWNELIRAQYAGLPLRQEATSLTRDAAKQARQLLDGERTLFEAGESSLFLLIQRENQWIESQRQHVGAFHLWQMARREYLWRWEGGS